MLIWEWQKNEEKKYEELKEWQSNIDSELRHKINKDNQEEHYSKYHEEYRKKCRNYENNKFKTDLKYKVNKLMGSHIRTSIKGNKNGRHWEDLVGYTLEDLIKHLKKTIPEGYIWEDYVNGELHVDHVIPKSAFNFTKPEHADFKRCWALENLRLLPAKDNMGKGNKLEKSFQPALLI